MNAHGCLAPCPVCKQGCPICNPCKPHCSRRSYLSPPNRQPFRCGMCGSTAIDHTETHCQLNRIIKHGPVSTGTDLAATDAEANPGSSNPPGDKKKGKV